MSSKPLRPYQAEAVDAIIDEWSRVRSTLLVAATGTGKSRMGAEVIARRAHLGRTLWLAHRTELLDQAQKAIRDATGLQVGREQAGRRANLNNLWGASDRVVVASIDTLHTERLHERFKPDDFATIIVDEAHHAVARKYRQVFDYFACANILGVTATPDRGDRMGLNNVFDSVAYQYDILRGVSEGYLCPIVARAVDVADLDISSVKVTMSAESGKDLNAGQIGKALEVDGVMHQIAAPLVELSKGRQTIVFTPSIASAEHLADVLRGYNVTVRSVSGETAHLERVGALAGYQLGRIQYITNCAVLTEGFDAPETSCVAIVRPTKSRALYAQMIGRGTRIAPGKTDCLVLDFVPSQAGKHKLVTPFDVLGGKDIDDETIKEARKFSDAGMTAQDALEAAESAKAERQEAERLRAEMKANRVKVQAEYKLRSIDPFGVCSPADLDGPLMKSATASRLASRNITLPPHTTEAAALKIEQEAKVRAMRNQATINQAKVLARHGLRTDMTKREASTILDALSNNGWKVPEPIWQMWRKAS